MTGLRRLLLTLVAVVAVTNNALATDLVAKKITFDPLPRVERNGRIGLEVTNSGTTPSGSFSVRFTVRYEGNVVYQQTASGSSILAEGSANVWTPYTFMPTLLGIHETTAEILYAGETDPSDNVIQSNANPLQAFISRDSATAVLDRMVLRSLPSYNALHAYHIPVTTGTTDSVHPAGTTLVYDGGGSSYGSYTIAVPSYVFYVDLDPTAFFGHPTLAVAIPAERGSKDTITTLQSTLPFMLNGKTVAAGSYCGPNPQRVLGQGLPCPTAPMFSSESTPNNTTCVLIITGAMLRDVDDATMRHDISSYITRMNSAPNGPRITFGSFLVRRGVNQSGITRQELQNEVNRLASVTCASLIVKYIGHSNADGLLLAGTRVAGTDVFTWDDLASMVRSFDNADVTVDLTTNAAQRAIPALQRQAILGSCIASADSVSVMPIGSGSGTLWEQAQAASMADLTADADKNDTITVYEAARHAIATHAPDDSVRRSNPTVADLNSPNRAVPSAVVGITDDRWTIPADGGNLVVSVEHIRMATSVKQGSARRDTVITTSVVYIDNPTSTDLRATGTYDIVAIGGRGSSRVDTVVASVRPHVYAGTRIAVATIPGGFTGLTLRVSPSNGGPQIESDTTEVTSAAWSVIVATHPSRFRTVLELTDEDSSRQYTTSVALQGGISPPVTLPPVVSTSASATSTVVVAGTLATASEGGGILATMSDAQTGSRTRYHTTVLRPVRATATTPLPATLRWNDVVLDDGDHAISSVRNSWIAVAPSATVTAGASAFDVQGSTMEFGASPAPALAWGNATSDGIRIGGLCLTGAGKLSIKHRDIILRSMRLGNAALTLTPTQGKHDVSAIGAYGSRGDAITVELSAATPSYTMYGTHVVRPDNFDIRVVGTGTVHCVDCSVNLPNTIAAGGSALHLRQNISAVVVDAAGSPRAGVRVDVVGRTGNVLATTTTDAQGFAMMDTVLVGITTNKLVDHRPVTVRMTAADGKTQEQQVRSSLWSQVHFVDSTLVGVADSPLARPSVGPLPLRSTLDAYVNDERGVLSVDLVSLTGHVLAHVRDHGSRRVRIPTEHLPAGAYVVVVAVPNARYTIPVVVY